MKTNGFLSANLYALGNQQSRSVDPPAPPGPTLTDFYAPDIDRHSSGLNCFLFDHTRALLAMDPEVPSLQSKLDRADELTDSESDEENGYVSLRPSLTLVKDILKKTPPPEPVEAPPDTGGKKGGKAAVGKDAKAVSGKTVPVVAPIEAPLTSDTVGTDAFSVLNDEDRKAEQVELLRDRKILDLENQILKDRQQIMNDASKR